MKKHGHMFESQEEALKSLKNLYSLCAWFVNTYYDEDVDTSKFKEPKKDQYLYQTTSRPTSNAEKNLIYIQTVDNSSGNFDVFEGNQTGHGSDQGSKSAYIRS